MFLIPKNSVVLALKIASFAFKDMKFWSFILD
jgi:hypothetical protein